ncbi:metallophosphoesterase [Streptomyces sp. ISL-10]|uniref:metallophosphoesterase n=1 Tax=Streptomyces sp. ISL-10 TaxID=2819172 RepID=UPI001BECF6EA|nr:metallophosphoesterase [Streptomyces sp. ISL-10]MBT2367786.1 metallophosphoesterase [Streptomyces sp. ISL-10]
MVAVVVLVIILAVALLATAHWYVWRRLVRDTTAPGGTARRVGTTLLWVLPLLSVGALMSGRAGAPFVVQQVLAWPGFLWLAVLLYLVLALAAGEALRPVLRRVLDRRAAIASSGWPVAPGSGGAFGAPVSGGGSAATGSADSPGAAGEGAGATETAVPAVSGGARAAAPVEQVSLPGDGAVATKTVGSPEIGGARAEGARTDAPASGGGSAATGSADSPGAAETAPADDEAAGADAPRAALSRRVFVARVVGGAAATAALGTVGYGTYGVLRGPRVKRVTVPLAKLPRAAHGYRIAVVSDIHLGPVLGRAHTRRIVDSINATQPDLVAVVGDLVDGSVADLGSAAEPLAGLRSRHGAFFVTGNHEYFSGADEWVDHVRELGLRPLRNERVEIAGGFDLAGVDDVAGESEGQGPDFAKALGDRDRSRAAVLLAHQPVVIHDAVEQGVDLQLSGHTHGGQLWPGNFLAGLANPTVAGLERYGDTQLYVSRGAGAWGPPVRVGAASDITVVQLASRQA